MSNPDAVYAQSVAAFKRRDFDQAIQLGDRLLEMTRGAPQAIAWSVRLRLEANRWTEAIEIGSGRTGTVPGLSGLIAHAYEALGDFTEAEKLYAAACREQPGDATWLYQRASALARLGREFEAMEVLKRATKIAPAPQPLTALAVYQLDFGDPAAALASAERALAMDPGAIEALAVAARSLMALSRSEEADRMWQRAIDLSPGDDLMAVRRAAAMIRLGRFAEGIESLKKIIQANPRSAQAYSQISKAKRLSDEDRPMVEAMETLAKDRELRPDEAISLRFALGKAYDNLGEFEHAIGHFDEANRLQGAHIEETGGFDRDAYATDMVRRIAIYSHQAIAEMAQDGNPSETPIFVLGMIRSGTTLAEQILSAHPLVSGAGEQEFWINADLRLRAIGADRLDEQTLRTAADVYLRLLNRFKASGTERVVDKQPGNLLMAGALHMAFPNARIIHMHRHPVDTAISIWTTHLVTSMRFVNDKGNIAFAMSEHDKLMQHWRETLPEDRFLDVSYESLITDRETVTRRMLEFCGLPWSDACLEPERNRSAVITPSLWQVRQPVYRTSIDRWKSYEPWLGEFRTLLRP